jgi:bromodomain-containing protein 7/9
MGKTKHKKHHRHGDEDEAVGEDGDGTMSGSAGLKLILKVGSKGHEKHKKKKKKKDKKKEHRDKERKHKHHHKEKRHGDGQEMTTEEGGEVKMEVEEKPPKAALNRLLEHMLHHLQKKDTNGFFANPVNDQFAPGYSSIITQPMDFATMRSKLPSYSDVATFRADFERICNNAMTYNTVDTIYYKMAKKLLHYGQKLFSVDKLRSMKNHLPFVQAIPDECLGIDSSSIIEESEEAPETANASADENDDLHDVAKVIEDIREVVRRPPGRFEAIPDDMTTAEILEQAKMAAKGASNRLKIYKPKSKMGFLRQKADGSTSLKFLTGSTGVVPGTDNDRPVSLGSLIGKVKQGTGSIQGFREDRRNLAKAIHPLYYGAFSSHGPSYDSTFANLTKEETELVYSTYCDNTGVQYAESVLNFSRNCDYAMNVVDHLLDILTGNEHRKTSKYIEECKMLRKEDELLDGAFKDITKDPEAAANETLPGEETIDFESLKSLQEDGIDMTFLDQLQKDFNSIKEEEEVVEVKEEKPEGPELLQYNAQLIEQLKKVQTDRLSAAPPTHFSQIQKPGDKELELASNIQCNLIEMAGQLKPENIVPDEIVRKSIAISVPITIVTNVTTAAADSSTTMEIE